MRCLLAHWQTVVRGFRASSDWAGCSCCCRRTRLGAVAHMFRTAGSPAVSMRRLPLNPTLTHSQADGGWGE